MRLNEKIKVFESNLKNFAPDLPCGKVTLVARPLPILFA
jgi:hypothetical protein